MHNVGISGKKRRGKMSRYYPVFYIFLDREQNLSMVFG